MLPPVTLQLTSTTAVSPAGVRATAISWAAPSVGMVTDLGVICRRIVALGPVTARGLSQPRAARATTSHASFSKANRRDNLCLNVMTLFSLALESVRRQRAPRDSWCALQRHERHDGCTGGRNSEGRIGRYLPQCGQRSRRGRTDRFRQRQTLGQLERERHKSPTLLSPARPKNAKATSLDPMVDPLAARRAWRSARRSPVALRRRL